MKIRCYCEGNPRWDRYGGRGIKVCDRWRNSFPAFLADMGMRPSPAHSIDRINNDGDYEPGNCRWATRIEQGRNTSRCVPVGDIARSISEAAEISGVKQGNIRARINRGLPVETVIAPGSLEKHRVIVGPDGSHRTLAEWARVSGVAASTILWRIKSGWDEGIAASTGKTHKHRPCLRKTAA